MERRVVDGGPDGRTTFLLHATTIDDDRKNNNNNKKKKKNNKINDDKKKGRPPRFTQTVHNDGSVDGTSSSTTTKTATKARQTRQQTSSLSSSSSVPTTTVTHPTDRVWQSRKKSVEELEGILAQRWGTSLSKFTAEDWDDGDGDGDDGTTSSSDTVPFRAKPVTDPWKDGEYYDEDDEGYAGDGGGGRLGHMISPRPAGSSGRIGRSDAVATTKTMTTTTTESSTPPSSSSYFLRPPPSVPRDSTTNASSSSSSSSEKTTTSKNISRDASSVDAPTVDSSHKKRERIVPIALLDEDGDPICLTVQQAELLFHEMTDGATNTVTDQDDDDDDDDEGDDEDEDESPLAAMAAQQSDQQWTDLGITDPRLLENLAAMSCAKPLPVQRSACSAILTDAAATDIVIGTYTGSGKTLAFVVPLVQRLMNQSISGDQLSVVIVAPGRELASQIISVVRQVCDGTPYTAQLAIGGTTFTRNLQNIRKRKPSILVCTPGRLAELIVGKPGEKGGRLKVSQLQSLVLDEFDALLEYKPHRDPTTAVVQCLRRNRNLQSILCSATASDMLDSPKFQQFVRPDFALAMTDQDDVFVTGSNDGDHTKLSKGGQSVRVSRTVMHGVVHVPHRRFVLETIRRILHTEPVPQQILMFVESSRKVDLMVEKLENKGILAAALHGGDRSEKMDRAEVSKALREGYVGVVVATEMAARGLDAPLLTHVINVDLPTDVSHYAHRAGRCGRGGRPGVVINLTFDPKERKVPQKFADQLGVDLYTVDVRNGRLNVVNPESVDLDNL